MEPDVEALLINRVGPAREYFLAPIDECYRLVGLIRTALARPVWRSRGVERDTGLLYSNLKNRCGNKTETMHA